MSTTAITPAEAIEQCDGERIRVHTATRKMSVPGRLHGSVLHTNWGLELDLTDEPITAIDLKDYDRNRWETAYTFEANEPVVTYGSVARYDGIFRDSDNEPVCGGIA